VQSVGVVPVGLTRFRRNNHYQIKLPIRPYAPEEGVPVVEQVERWQRRFRDELDVGFAYLSDEWYIMAGRPVPRAREYDGYPQIENGVGLVRQLLNESRHTALALPQRVEKPTRAVVVCGEMPRETLERGLEPLRKVGNLDLRLVVVKNDALGGNVACSGLLFGKDVVPALAPFSRGGEEAADLIFLPKRMFDFTGTRTLDEWTVESFQEELGVPVIPAEWTRDIWHSIERHQRGEECFSKSPELERESALG
jgi:NifB/MoaA-like Fe-S oxidoreductase